MKPAYILLALACLFALIVCPVSADIANVPSLPAQFYGTLYNHEGKPFPAGTVITAEVNGITSTFTLTEAGKIGGSGTFDDKFLISGAVVGSEITYSVAGTDISVTQTYNPSSAQQTAQIQLTIPVEIPDSSAGVTPPAAETPQAPPELPTHTPQSDVPTTPPVDIPSPSEPNLPASPAPLAGIILALALAGLTGRK